MEEKAVPVEISKFEEMYPLTYNYIIENTEIFQSRENEKARDLDPWYSYIYPKNLNKFEQQKLPSMEICSTKPNITLDEKNIYHSTTVCSWIQKSPVLNAYEYLLGIANSKILWWFLKITGDTLQGDARRLKTNYLTPFPIPRKVNTELEKTIILKVREALSKKERREDIDQLEEEIDQMIYAVYRLTPEQIREVNARQ